MAIFYTDLALRQSIGANFPGQPGSQLITNLPANTGQTNALYEGPIEIIATYTLVGTEAAGDTINIAKLEAGVVVDPNGKISSGVAAPATTLTASVGDNDLGNPANLPLVNPSGVVNSIPLQPLVTAPPGFRVRPTFMVMWCRTQRQRLVRTPSTIPIPALRRRPRRLLLPMRQPPRSGCQTASVTRVLSTSRLLPRTSRSRVVRRCMVARLRCCLTRSLLASFHLASRPMKSLTSSTRFRMIAGCLPGCSP